MIPIGFITAAHAVLAAGPGPWGEGDGEWWWVARLVVTVVWIALVVVALRWLVFGRGRWGRPSAMERARGVLAERYARGEIDAQEYEERSKRLR